MVLPDIRDYIREGRKYNIYGTKTLGKYCFHAITKCLGKEAVVGFMETKPHEEICCHKRIYALDEAGGLAADTDIVVASANFCEEIRNGLLTKGIEAEKIIMLDNLYPYFKSVDFFNTKDWKKICFWPPLKKDDLDIQKKIAWFLPDKTEVIIWCEEDMENDFGGNVSVGKQEEAEQKFEEADIIFVWRAADCTDVPECWRDKMYVADPDFWFYVETTNYGNIYYCFQSDSEKKTFIEESEKMFYELKTDAEGKRANIFCSGPSLEETCDKDFETDLNIIANSMVKDKKFLKKIRPKLLVYSDVNFYISPNAYCLKFYKDVLDAVKKYDMKIVVFEQYKPLIQHHYPELKGKIIGIPCNADQFVFPGKEHFQVKKTGNILTELLLPVASALCDEIGIAGCTGRHPDEAYYWRHNPDTQYLDDMQSVFDMYPSVFRDQSYDDYYDRHCGTVEKILKYGERLGRKYRNLTTSYIPALRAHSVVKTESGNCETL